MKKMLLNALCLLVFIGMKAQGITGKLVDEQGTPIGYANIVALTLPDSAFVAGTISQENGIFSLEVDDKGQLLRFTSVGYNTRCVPRKNDMGVITLQSSMEMLGEIVVKGTLPKTRMKGDAMVTGVAGTVLEKAGSMEQLLDRIPNVTAYGGEIEVFGRGTPEIYINGRKMTDPMELERLSSDNIRNVEVITNPGARYSATVKSVIRITTKLIEGEGFGFDARALLNYRTFTKWSETGRFNFNYRKGGFDLTGMLYMADNKVADNKTLTNYTYLDKNWEQSNDVRSEMHRINPYGQLGLNYMFNPEHSIGVNFSYDRYPSSDNWMDLASTVRRAGELIETSTNSLTSTEQETIMQSNFYYTGKIGDWGIDFNTDWYWNKEDSPVTAEETYQETGGEKQNQTIHTETVKRSQLIASKLVISAPLWEGKLDFGGEYSYSKRKTIYTVLPVGFIDDDRSRIQEGMTSAFVEYFRKFGPVNVQAGLRYENINFDYYEDEKYMAGQSRVFNNLFPSFSLSATLGAVDLQLGYATDVNRPSYWALRSSVLYANRYTYETGNPFLTPQINNNVNFGASWKWINLNVVYSHISDPITSYSDTYKDDPTVTLLQSINGNAYDQVNASFTFQPKIGIWSPSLTMAVTKQWYDMEVHGGKSVSNPMGTFRFNNTFDTKWVMLSILMNAATEGNTENIRMDKGRFRTDLSLYKSFLKDRLSVQLDVRDLFQNGQIPSIIYSGTMRSMYYSQKSERETRITLRYKFNVAKSKYKGSGAGQEQLRRM